MKRFFGFLCFLLVFACQINGLWAQNRIVTTVTPRTSLFPATGFTYLDNPERYFSVLLTNITNEQQQIYISMEIYCEFSAIGSHFRMATDPKLLPMEPYVLGPGQSVNLTRADMDQLFSGYSMSNVTMEGIDWQTALQLPEGQYRFCITPYIWQQTTGTPQKAGESGCCFFNICYSGSAPEFVSPIVGQSANNLNNPIPIDRRSRFTNLTSSDNRFNGSYAQLTPTRHVNFRWTAVISNCVPANYFDYHLKLVEVHPYQNVQDAINNNPTIASINNKSNTSYTVDTLTNRQFHFEKGHTYAAQVEARLKTIYNSSIIRLGNEGKSQIITFVWGESNITGNDNESEAENANVSINSSDNHQMVINTIRPHYITSPANDINAINNLKGAFPAENAHIPSCSVPYDNVNGERLYQVPKGDNFTAGWMPLRGDSVTQVFYNVSLYKYIGGDISNSLMFSPVVSTAVGISDQAHFATSNTSSYTPDLKSFTKYLEEGEQYLLLVKAVAQYHYAVTTTTTSTEIIGGIPVMNDNSVTSSATGTYDCNSHILFTWGVDSSLLRTINPAEFSFPDNYVSMDSKIQDIISMEKPTNFTLRWDRPENISARDRVQYDIAVFEVKKNTANIQEVLSGDTLFSSKNITNTNFSNPAFRDSLKIGKAYIVQLRTRILDNSPKYQLLNNGLSKLVAFKFTEPTKYTAQQENTRLCHPDALDNLDKNIITPEVQTLSKNKTEIKIGDFPLIITQAELDTLNKTYKGDGYIKWKPYGKTCHIKVHFEGLQINSNYQAINGYARSYVQENTSYVPLEFGYGWSDWNNYKPGSKNSVAAANYNLQSCKNMYLEFKGYPQAVVGIRGKKDVENPDVLTLPLAIDKTVTLCKDAQIAVGEMYFTPKTALMNMTAIFSVPKDNTYLPFVASSVCMTQDGMFSEMGEGLDLYLAKNMKVVLSDKYTLDVKRADQLGNPANGTFLQIQHRDSIVFSFDAELSLGNQFIKIDMSKDWKKDRSSAVKAYFSARFTDWDNWVARISMDAFTLNGCDDYTFVPTGNGIFYDHSDKYTPAAVSFPNDYGVSDRNAWKGFYWDDFTVLLPEDLSSTFTDLNGKNQEKASVTVNTYRYDTLTNTIEYSYPAKRIRISATKMIIDKNGLTVNLTAIEPLQTSTQKAGGWGFDIDTIALSFVKNHFIDGCLIGDFQLPLCSGRLDYRCVLGQSNYEFLVEPKKNSNFKLDLWLAMLKLDKASSYFSIKKVKEIDHTLVDLTLNGVISIDFNKLNVPVRFDAVRFENMYMRNYSMKDGVGKGQGGKEAEKDDFQFEGFSFDPGIWSLASPQKMMGVYTEQTADDDVVLEGSISGFSYSVSRLEPFWEPAGNNYQKMGIKVAGLVKIGTGSTSISAGAGFQFWGNVRLSDFDIKNVKGQLDSITIKTHLDMFKLDGKMAFFKGHSVYGDGVGGTVKVSFLGDKVTFAAGVGFGSKGHNSGKYDWWYIEGVANCKPGIPLGGINLTGLGGGFAYNMEALNNTANQNPRAMRKAAMNTDFSSGMVSSGMAFKPSKDSWVAKAGVAIALASPNTMNAEGILNLRIANKHFSGITLQVKAEIATKFDKATETNSNSTLTVGTFIDYSETKEKSAFTFAMAIEGGVDLSALLKIGKKAQEVPCPVSYPSSGSSLSTFVEPEGTESGAMEQQRNKNNKKGPGAGIKISVPIEFQFVNYKKGYSGPISGKDKEWYVAIGHPPYQERCMVSMYADMIVCKAESEFTFYLMCGNYIPGGFTLPDLPPDVKNFLGDKLAKAEKGRKMPTFENAGGFAMGCSFKAKVEFDLFLYVDVNANLGFDVALLDVNAQGCGSYQPIGKNNFYALGQVYAMLAGDIGLSLNLGFWKGKLSLLSLGVGALLQGGGPNPTWCYGLLRLKCKCLGGLIKINTSCDFRLGDVCIPDAPDPLANVKLFESISPGKNSIKEARTTENIVSPFSIGTITSNMPWNEEVILCSTEADGVSETARRFIFLLEESKCNLSVTQSTTSNNPTWKSPKYPLRYTVNSMDPNTIFFEGSDGGLEASRLQQLKLRARAFEWRKRCTDCTNASTDKPVNIHTFKQTSAGSETYTWYNPTYTEKGKQYWKEYATDTTVYFNTSGMPDNLYNQVLYTWPYNGDPAVPRKEMGQTAYIFLYKDRSDLFDSEALRSQGKQLKAFLVDNDVDVSKEGTELYNLRYADNCISVDHFLGQMEEKKTIPHAIKFMIVNSDKYQALLEKRMEEMKNTAVIREELHSRDLQNLGNASGQTTVTSTYSEETLTFFQSTSNYINTKIDKQMEKHQKDIERQIGISHQQTTGSHIRKPAGSHIRKPAGTQTSSNIRTPVQSSSQNYMVVENVGLNMKTNFHNTKTDITAAKKSNNAVSIGLTVKKNSLNTGDNVSVKPFDKQQYSQIMNHNNIGTLISKAHKQRGSIVATGINNGTHYLEGAIIIQQDQNNGTQFQQRFPGTATSLSSDDNYNIEKAQAYEGVKAYQEDGADTSMLYKRRLRSDYELAQEAGIEIYTLYFQCNNVHTTYQELMAYIANSRPKFSPRAPSTYVGGCVSSTLNTGSLGKSFEKYAYLFAEYTPDNPKLYREGVVLPPICQLVIDQRNTYQRNKINEAINRHYKFSEFFTKMLHDRQALVSAYFTPSANTLDIKDLKENNRYYTQTHISKVNNGNAFMRSQTASFKNIDYRMSYNNTSIYSVEESGNYTPKMYQDDRWSCPNVLNITVPDDYVPYIDSSYFQQQSNGIYKSAKAWDFSRSKSSNKYAILKDYATPAIYDDIKKYTNLIQELHGYAIYFHLKSFSQKRTYLNTYYTNSSKVDLCLSITDFPYQIKKHLIPTSYFNCWNSVKKAIIEKRFPGKSWLTAEEMTSSNLGITNNLNWIHPNSLWIKNWLLYTGMPLTQDNSKGLNTEMITDKKSTFYKNLGSSWFNSLTVNSSADIKHLSSQKYYVGYHLLTSYNKNSNYTAYKKIANNIKLSLNQNTVNKNNNGSYTHYDSYLWEYNYHMPYDFYNILKNPQKITRISQENSKYNVD